MASRGALGRRNVSSCARTSRHRRSPYYARKRGSPCGLADLLNTGPSHAWRARSMVDWKRSHSGFSRKEVEDVLWRRRSINRSRDHCTRARLSIDRDHPDHSWSARRRFRLLRQQAGAIAGDPFTNPSTASGGRRISSFRGASASCRPSRCRARSRGSRSPGPASPGPARRDRE